MNPAPRLYRWRRYGTAALFLCLAGAAVWWQAEPVALQLATASHGVAVDAIYASGVVEPTVMMPIAPRTGGRLAERLVDEGAVVRKGQVLARLDDADLAGAVDEQRARAGQARSQHERARALAERGYVSPAEQERTGAELAAAEAALRRVRAQRDYMALTAPADGVIIRRDSAASQYIGPGQPVFVLACCAPLRVSAEVDEEDISQVHAGMPVVLKAGALAGRLFDGAVAEVTPKGDPVMRSYRVRIALAEPGPLRTGMTVDANLIVARHERALLVPATALSGDTLWVLANGRLQQRRVATGIHGGGQVEITGGLQAGEHVVLHPDGTLREGRRARALPQPGQPVHP